ncbi:hypothetical protein ACFU99_44280 [Streptomyces sp. NPDC057654]|uniref:hypothetical protein n=1 Tax=Streptomyces sp. NPDC057654 TaxID=3346196 RepID=UPI003688D8B6
MATPNPTDRPTRPTPPAPGNRTSVRVDAALSDDLAVVMSAGGNASDAIRTAVAMWADMHRTAWAHGVCPDGTRPRLLAYQLEQQQTPTPGLNSRYDAASDAPSRVRRVSPRLPEPPPGRHLPA